MFTLIHKNDWFKKKATVFRSEKVEIISTFQWNRYFREASVNKTFTHVQEQKKAMSPRHSAYIPSSVKSPLYPGKRKTDNYKKIITLFKYCFSYKLKSHSKTPAFPRNQLIFFPTNLLINIAFYWTGCNKIYIIITSYSKTWH